MSPRLPTLLLALLLAFALLAAPGIAPAQGPAPARVLPVDRIVAMMAGSDSIRDVIAFPKTQRAQCLLTQAPSPVDEKQLRELHIKVR